jgi:hypothetical protein
MVVARQGLMMFEAEWQERNEAKWMRLRTLVSVIGRLAVRDIRGFRVVFCECLCFVRRFGCVVLLLRPVPLSLSLSLFVYVL